MDRNLGKIIGISVIVFIFGGIGALAAMWDAVFQILVAFFPVICEAGKMALEEYLTSPYFIAGVIMTICSCVGIYFGVKGGKKLYIIVSIIVLIIELSSVGTSFLK